MNRMLLALAVALAAASAAAAQTSGVAVTFSGGRVTVTADDAPVADVLREWARAGGTVISGVETLPPTRITVALVDVAETEALQAVVGAVGGYIFTRRPQPVAGQSAIQQLTVAAGGGPAPGVASAPGARPAVAALDMSMPEVRFAIPGPMDDQLEAILKEREEMRLNAPRPLSPAEAQVMPELRFFFPGPVPADGADSPPAEPEVEPPPPPQTRKPPPGL